jgi:hypothetical protein
MVSQWPACHASTPWRTHKDQVALANNKLSAIERNQHPWSVLRRDLDRHQDDRTSNGGQKPERHDDQGLVGLLG